MLYNQGIDDEEQAMVFYNQRINKRNCKFCLIVGFVLLLFIAVVVALIIIYWPCNDNDKSEVRYYKSAAIATDSALCSSIGKEILLKNGSAVDAAIASMLCIGLYHAQSCGLGGGFFMIVYDSPRAGGPKEMLTFDARESAPFLASESLYSNGSSHRVGGKAIAVPGEVKGYHEAWLKFGKLEWSQLFQPAIEMCKKGFPVGRPLAMFIKKNEAMIRNTSSLAHVFLKPGSGDIYHEEDTMTRPDLVPTFQRIAAKAEDFYTGKLAEDIIQDIKEFDGIMTMADLANYSVAIKPAFSLHLNKSNITVYSLPPPSAGPIYAFMLRLLDGLDLSELRNTLTYHKIVEAFKFGYALKTYLGDEDFEDLSIVMKNLSSSEFVAYIKSRVDLLHTHNISYYNPQLSFTNEAGTSHLSIVASNGGVVSATTTINQVFGSQRRGKRSGIIFNDEMDDFTFKQGVGRENFVRPRKRPQSSMCPAILFKDGAFKMAIGGAGGSEITTAVTFVTANEMWLGMKIDEAVNTERLHHQLFPNQLLYQKNFPQKIVNELKALGHDAIEAPARDLISVVQVVQKICQDDTKKCLVAVSDARKYGIPDGY